MSRSNRVDQVNCFAADTSRDTSRRGRTFSPKREGFLQQWHAGKNEGIHTRLLIGLQRRMTVSGEPTIAVPGRDGQARLPAKDGGDFQIAQVLGFCPPCIAVMRCWPTEIGLADKTLVGGNRCLIHAPVKGLQRRPRLLHRIAHDNIEANTFPVLGELSARALTRSTFAPI